MLEKAALVFWSSFESWSFLKASLVIANRKELIWKAAQKQLVTDFKNDVCNEIIVNCW